MITVYFFKMPLTPYHMFIVNIYVPIEENIDNANGLTSYFYSQINAHTLYFTFFNRCVISISINYCYEIETKSIKKLFIQQVYLQKC